MSEDGKTSLPHGWSEIPLREILLPTATTNPARDGNGHFDYIDIEAVDNARQRIGNPKRLACALAPSRARNQLEAGDLVFSLVRPYLKNIAIIPDEFRDAVASTAFFVCRPGTGIDPRYLLNFLRRDSFIASITTYGNSPPSARDDEFDLLSVLIPPAPEQTRIADELDELFSDLDAGVAALERVREKLKTYRAAVLKAAVDGSLTATWRKKNKKVEPAAELLQRILDERRRRWEEEQLKKFAAAKKEPPKNWKANYPQPVPPEDVELPVVPNGWAVASMDQITNRITSGSRDWKQYYDRGTGTFIMAQNVRPGKLDLSARQIVDPPRGDSDCERSQVERGDLLVTIVGANTGDVCRVPEKLPEHYVCQSVALMRPVDAEISEFLHTYCQSLGGAQHHYRRYIYGAGRPHLSFDQLKMTPVLLPPLAEQTVIVEAVEDQLSVIEHVEAEVEAKLKSAGALRQAILRHAFAGKLVRQNPKDEPAAELLKRIAAERAERERLAREAKQKKKRESTKAKNSNHWKATAGKFPTTGKHRRK